MTAMQWFSVCSTLLFIKFSATTIIQGGKAFEAGSRPPEDNALLREGQPQQTYCQAIDERDQAQTEVILKARDVDLRWRRIVQNDLESIPIALVIMLGSVLVGGNETINSLMLFVYMLARYGHTFAYALEMQPHRSGCWIVGQICVMISGLNGMISFVF